MRKLKTAISLLLTVVMLAGCFSTMPLQSSAEVYNRLPEGNTSGEATSENAAENELLVSFKESVSDRKIEKTVEAQDAEVESIVEVGSVKLAQISVSEDLTETAAALCESRYVQSVQPNYKYTISADDPYMGDDIYAKNQYQFEATKALEAWNELESAAHAKTKVAVVDTGVDLLHEDLQANLVKETDGKYAHFEYGNYIRGTDDYDEEDGHGTHVSGIIGATYGNGKGGSGIAAGHNNDLVELMTVSASADGYNLFTIDIVSAIAYAAEHGAKVINMSFGGAMKDRIMEDCIKDAYYNDGIVFVAASGNEDTDIYNSPSDLKEVISVNASNRYNEPMYFSNYGTEKDITAPGDQILSTIPGDDYINMSGTSMASPVVAAIAALVLDANPNLTPAQVYNILCASANQPAGVDTLFDTSSGYGIVDAEAAVKAAKAAKSSAEIEQLTIKQDEITLFEEEDYGAEVLTKPATALAEVKWSSSDSSVASVDANTGIITAVKAGTAVISAAAGGKEVSLKVTVKPSVKAEDMIIKGIPESRTVAVDDVIYLDVSFVPEDTTINDYYLKSSNPSVVGAFEGGIIVGFKVGSATVTVTNFDGSIKKEYEIIVKSPVADVVFTKQANWVLMGDSYKFTAKSVDADGKDDVANGEITYTSSNKKVFTIDKDNGTVTPVAVGKAFVIATNETSGEFAAKQILIVKNKYATSDYALKQTARTKDSITISWTSIPVAANYKIERKDSANGAWKTVKTVGKSVTSFKNTGLKAGKVYYYRVSAVNASYKGTLSPSNAPAMTTTPNYALKQSAKTKTSITLKWNKAPDAASYVIQYRASKSAAWKTIKTVNAKTLTYRHTGLKAGKSVYYRIYATYKVGTSVRNFTVSPAIVAKTAK